jgi:SOS-response transcriptional repressor LexA
MRSSCRAREFSINPFQLSSERRRNLPRVALSERDTPDMGRIDPELPGNPAEYPGLHGNSEKVLVGRDIFVGHNLAGQNSALLLPQNYCRSNNPESSKKEEVALPSLPLWAVQIDKLLKSQRLTQQAFAAKMNVTQGSVSAWISGRKEPKPEFYFRMAKLWPSAPDVAHWLKRASDLSGAFQIAQEPVISQRKTARSTRRVKFGKLSSDAVEIPLLKDPAATGTPRQVNENEIEDFLAFPGSLCPHPDEIVCIKVQGDSMSPLLEDGYIVAVDTAQTDRARLHGQMVAARDPEGGVTIKWLRKLGKQEILLSQHTSQRHQPTILSQQEDQESGWAVVGKVLWWIGMPS